MKEIDLLPDWYKNGKRHQRNLRAQYIALVGILLIAIVWNFFAVRSVSKAKEQFAKSAIQKEAAQKTIEEFKQVENRVAALQAKVEILEKIDSRINVSGILSELSFLIDRAIVLDKIEFKAERVQDNSSAKNSGGLRVASRASANGKGSLVGDVIFKAVIKGIAARTSNVGQLVRKLEDSPYFCSVSLSFSRNKKMMISNELKKEDAQVSEFEVSCYLANYEQNTYLAKK